MGQELSITGLKIQLEEERKAKNDCIIKLREICIRAGFTIRCEDGTHGMFEWVKDDESRGGYKSLMEAVVGCIEVNFGKKI